MTSAGPSAGTFPTPAHPISQIPAKLPSIPIPPNVPHEQIAKACLARLSRSDLSVFAPSSHWRDLLALTSTLRTFNTRSAIQTAWTECARVNPPSSFSFMEGSSKVVGVGEGGFISARFRFDNGLVPVGRCSGAVMIVVVDGEDGTEFKIWSLSTMLEVIDGFGDPDVFPDGLRPRDIAFTNGIASDVAVGERNATSDGKSCVDALVVGLGPAGLASTARLKALGLSVLGCERYPAVGMNWTERYDSLRLHTPKVQNSLPFGFVPPKDAPHYLAMKDLQKYYQSFVDEFGLKEDLWVSTIVEKADWDAERKRWTVVMDRDGQKSKVEARHLVFCVGLTGRHPKHPSYPSREMFKGDVLHAVEYTNAEKWAGRRGIVIGTANTGHDVAEDMANTGMHVTMVQRNPTAVVSYANIPMFSFYNDNADVSGVDKEFQMNPLPVDRLLTKGLIGFMAQQDKSKFDMLEERGFKVDREFDLTHIIYERAGGHYLDVGASQLVIDGKIHVKSGSPISSFTASGLKFADGSELEADVVVFATGYEGSMRMTAAEIVGEKIAKNMDECWKLDSEGQPRGSWKPIGQENAWYCPGDITSSRFFSRFIALQIKAEVEGRPFQPYDKRL